MQDSGTTESPARDDPSADVILNRLNVALARSQRLIQSWLPPAPPAESGVQQDSNADDDEPLNEVGGIGSKAAQEDVDAFGLPRKKHSTNDKLLEQILGKRGAEAKRKKDAREGKDTANGRYGKALPLVEKSKQEKKRTIESDDDEEGGRATAFKSRKMQPTNATKDETGQALGSKDMEGDADTTVLNDTIPDPVEKPSKRKTNSYLDEVLAKKSMKKKKKSKVAQLG